MADFYIDIDGNVTKNKGSKKKKKQSDFYIDINGNVTKTNDDDIAPVKESTEKRTWFEKGAFEDGYQFGDVFKTAVGTVRDVEQNLTAGILGIAEAVVDAGAYLVGGVGGLFGADEFKDKTKKFIADDLIDEKKAARAILGAKNPLYVLDPLSLDDSSALGDKTDSIVQSGGQLIGTIGLQAVGVPWFVTTGVTSFGKETESAFNEGASYGEAGISGLITAGAEILTEKISGGIKFGGSTLDDGLTKALATKISDKFTRTALKLGLDVVGEGAEEVLSEDISRFGQWLTYQDDKTLTEMLWSEEAMNEKIEAFIGGAMLGGAGSGINVARSSAVGRDATTGLTSNEEKVFKHVYESRVAEAEKNGETLSKSDKNKIYDEVMEELQKGAISTDTIEEALGGETYKTYKNTVESEDALLKEFDELGKKTSPTLADQSRYAELKEQIKGIKENSQRTQLKKQLGEEVFGLAKQGNDSYLLESYADTARRGQAFEADVKKYDAKQQKVIQAAIDSGILNNTRRTHEFVDMVAKISADKGVSFDFLNNEKLKNSGFAVDGKFVNGYLDKKTNTIGVNINSAKSLNTVVGHEISHVLEGTELYGEMQKAIFEYAKSKKDYDGRRKALESLYKAEDIDSELTADLVGDYLFSDPDFVKQLSVNNRNLFQKIYDEIKYLLKVVTAGSKEEKELLKVKKAFEDAYCADSKTEAKGEKAYSLSEYSDHQKKNWESSKRIVVYENGEQFSQFIQDSIDNKIIDKKMYFGAISADLASRIQADTGLDVENYNLSLGSFEIRKILKDHGSEETEAPRGQRAITPDDFSHIVDIVLNPTSIELSENTYMGKPAIEFTGNYNGRMNVVAVVSDKRLDLFVQTIYANIKKENLSTPIGEQAPINTPEANSGTVSRISIA